MIKDKKLASPVKCQNFLGDNNDDIPQQMTEDQPLNMVTHTCPGGYHNTMVTDHWNDGCSSPTGEAGDKLTQKQVRQMQKNQNNFLRHQSNLQKK